MATRRIAKQIVDGATASSRDCFIWDTELKGFGLKVSSAGKKTYICEYRTVGGRTGRRRRYALGRHGSLGLPRPLTRKPRKSLVM